MSHSPEQRRSRSRSRSASGDNQRSSARHRRRSDTFSHSPEPPACKRLHIANIDDSVRKRDIEEIYGKYGKLSDIWVASYPPFYAFVVYEHSEHAAAALKEMKSGYVRDCHVRTSIALPRNSGRRGPPPRRHRDDRRRSRSPYRRRRTPSPPRRSRSPRRSRHHRSRSDSR